MKRFDGTQGSLHDRSHRPHTPHPNSHTTDKIKYISDLIRRTPDISLMELFGKLKRNYQFTRTVHHNIEY